MADLKPHPLVVDVGTELAGKGKLGAKLAQKPTDEQLAWAVANEHDQPDLKLISGFVGAQIKRGANWRLVYLDSLLYTWLLVPEDDVIASQRLKDPNAPSGERDMLWVNRTAKFVYGSGFGPDDRRFLVGELTSAADFKPERRGGAFSAASGLLCDATTPDCVCYRSRTVC
jgi:hypothetical protein